MSFALEVKEELARKIISNHQELESMLEAIFRNGAELSILGLGQSKLTLHSRSNSIIRAMIKALNAFKQTNYNLYQKQIMRFDKPIIYYLEITENVDFFIKELNILNEDHNHKQDILSHEHLKSSYLRGAFIVCGSVNDPDTSKYHLEFRCENNNEALFLQNIINSYDLNARITKRRDSYVVYVKEIETICDILRIMGATDTVFYFEEKVINRSMVTQTKRKIAFDISNQMKANEAAMDDLKYIKYLEYNYPLEKLDPKLLMIMKVRKDNPEASLSDLAKIIEELYDIKISKSGVSHRMRKLKEIAADHKRGN